MLKKRKEIIKREKGQFKKKKKLDSEYTMNSSIKVKKNKKNFSAI